MTELQPGLIDEAVEIDAFGLAPDWSSSVEGLGGVMPGIDSAYVFHTPYEEFGAGNVLATLTFEGFTASRGTLILRVNAYPDRPGAVAYEVMLREVPMFVIAIDEGVTTITFTPRPGTRYAILGHVYDDTDAAATGLRIRAEREAKVEEEMRLRVSQRRSAFGAATIRPVPRLLSNHPAQLGSPVSQMCTLAQIDEPAFAEWSQRLGDPGIATARWPAVYTLQVLRNYGVLEPGANGLDLCRGKDALPR